MHILFFKFKIYKYYRCNTNIATWWPVKVKFLVKPFLGNFYTFSCDFVSAEIYVFVHFFRMDYFPFSLRCMILTVLHFLT